MEFVDKIVIKVALSENDLKVALGEKKEHARFSYRIWDGRTGNQMFFAEEDEKIFNNATANFCSSREFVMPFVDAMGNEGFKLNKTRSITAHICCCCCNTDSCFKHLYSTYYNYDND